MVAVDQRRFRPEDNLAPFMRASLEEAVIHHRVVVETGFQHRDIFPVQPARIARANHFANLILVEQHLQRGIAVHGVSSGSLGEKSGTLPLRRQSAHSPLRKPETPRSTWVT